MANYSAPPWAQPRVTARRRLPGHDHCRRPTRLLRIGQPACSVTSARDPARAPPLTSASARQRPERPRLPRNAISLNCPCGCCACCRPGSLERRLRPPPSPARRILLGAWWLLHFYGAAGSSVRQSAGRTVRDLGPALGNPRAYPRRRRSSRVPGCRERCLPGTGSEEPAASGHAESATAVAAIARTGDRPLRGADSNAGPSPHKDPSRGPG